MLMECNSVYDKEKTNPIKIRLDKKQKSILVWVGKCMKGVHFVHVSPANL
jgi:hypothetical protein